MSSTKIALVTGGSRGLGKNMALSLAKKGIDVIITYNQQQSDAQDVVAQIEQIGQKASALELDTSDVKSFDGFVDQFTAVLQDTFSTNRFNFLINNAGTGLQASISDTAEEDFDQLMNIHFKGVFFLTQKLLPVLNDGGRIINISTGLTRIIAAGSSAYAAMKGAIEVLTKYMAVELGQRRIAVNVVAPGAIETDFRGGTVRDNPEVNKYIANLTALGRVGLPDDIGGVVAFLCTDEAGWINAQRIEVSGGQRI